MREQSISYSEWDILNLKWFKFKMISTRLMNRYNNNRWDGKAELLKEKENDKSSVKIRSASILQHSKSKQVAVQKR